MAEEEEDLNAFNLWDSVGAAIMLGIVPAVMSFVFNDHDILSVATWGGVALLAGFVVYILGLMIPVLLLSRFVNLIAYILTPIYIVVAIILWGEKVKEDIPSATPLEDVHPAQK